MIYDFGTGYFENIVCLDKEETTNKKSEAIHQRIKSKGINGVEIIVRSEVKKIDNVDLTNE